MLNAVPKTSPSFHGGKVDLLKKGLKHATDAKNLGQETGKVLKEAIPEPAHSKVLEWIAKPLKAMDGVVNWAMKKPDAAASILAVGNVCKEAFGTAFYTIQALTNEDLPKDKRKFVGMYDLGVGVVSTTLMGVAGALTVRFQGPVIKAMVGAKNMAKHAKAVTGLKFAIPLITQTILVKRVIAPAVATPVAGVLKKKLEAWEAKKQGKQPQEAQQSALQKQFEQKTSSPVVAQNDSVVKVTKENAFDMYKTFKAKA